MARKKKELSGLDREIFEAFDKVLYEDLSINREKPWAELKWDYYHAVPALKKAYSAIRRAHEHLKIPTVKRQHFRDARAFLAWSYYIAQRKAAKAEERWDKGEFDPGKKERQIATLTQKLKALAAELGKSPEDLTQLMQSLLGQQ
ncbi:MAG: hypothetical protein KatS3mg087_1339 [Patescibacteria group bacterium]|nr:MAG: hypothetical protein KatS3mg087_1339 [Patescibacteria group bacterium]